MYRDRVIKILHDHYYKCYWAAALLFFIVDPYFFLFFLCFGGYFIVSVGDNISNYLFHSPQFGYRTYNTKDNSRNVPIISWITLGAGWHNNHHHNPGYYKFGEKPNEIDIGAKIVEIIRK